MIVVNSLTINEILKGVSFTLEKGEMCALIGPSGSGKSLTARAITRLLPRGLEASGEILWQGRDLLTLSKSEMQSVRGCEIGLIFQDPFSALNPTQKIGTQIAEAVSQVHSSQIRERVHELLINVDLLPQHYHYYPFQLSGGMCQRACIAMSLALEPKLLIADEPTTALDIDLQHQIMQLLAKLQRERGLTILFITHDVDLVTPYCNRILTLEEGQLATRSP